MRSAVVFPPFSIFLVSKASSPESVVIRGQSSVTSNSRTLSLEFPSFVTVTLRIVSVPEFMGPTGSAISTFSMKISGISKSPIFS